MAALTGENSNAINREGQEYSLDVKGGKHIHLGAIVQSMGSYLCPAEDVAGARVLGYASGEADNSGGADGDIVGKYNTGCIIEADCQNLTPTDLWSTVFIIDDHTVGPAGDTTHSNKAGLLMMLSPDNLKGCIYVPPFGLGL